MATLVQSVGNTITTANSLATTVSATGAGSLIVVFVYINGAETVTSVTDGASNTYQKAISTTNVEIWYAYNCTSTTTVTANFSASSNSKNTYVREYSGMDTTASVFDQSAVGSGSHAAGTFTASTSASSATTSANEIVMCSLSLVGGASPSTAAAGSGFGNLLTQVGSIAQRQSIEDETVSSTGAQTGTIDYTGGTGTQSWNIALATFVIAGSALSINVSDTITITESVSLTGAIGNVGTSLNNYENVNTVGAGGWVGERGFRL